jgi:hypothetical protein
MESFATIVGKLLFNSIEVGNASRQLIGRRPSRRCGVD